MAKSKKKKRKASQRSKNEQAWRKETKRIKNWARRMKQSGVDVDFGDVLDMPERITKKRLEKLQSIRGSKLYDTFDLSAGKWTKQSQAYAYEQTGVLEGQKLNKKAVAELRKYQREYEREYSDSVERERLDQYDMAFENCAAALRGSPYDTGRAALSLLHQYEDSVAVKRRLFELDSWAVERCWEIGWHSNDTVREQSFSELFVELDIVLSGPELETLTTQG